MAYAAGKAEGPLERSDASAGPYVERIRELFVRVGGGPILTAKDMPFENKGVLNPGAAEVEGETLLLLRVIRPDNRSMLVVARSADGVGDWRVESKPLIEPSEWYDVDGCEDPRITYLADRDEYAITYVGVSRMGAGVCLALTKDFRTVERLGLVLHPYNKDAMLLPERVRGKYRLLHRPTAGPREDVWMSESEDLLHWGHPENVIEEDDRPGWQHGKVGAGAPPIRGKIGWFLVYHGVELARQDHWIYRTGIAILDPEEPSKVLRHWPDWVFGPQEPYEFDEKGQGIVFPTGLLVKEGRLRMYYGAGDLNVGLATADVEMMRRIGEEFHRAQEGQPESPQ